MGTIPPSSEMIHSDRNSTWFKRSELESFKENAKVACNSIRKKRKLSSISDNKETTNGVANVKEISSFDNCTRGLELAVDSERKKERSILIKSLLRLKNQ